MHATAHDLDYKMMIMTSLFTTCKEKYTHQRCATGIIQSEEFYAKKILNSKLGAR